MKSIFTRTDKKIRSALPSVVSGSLKFTRRTFDPVAYAAALEILG